MVFDNVLNDMKRMQRRFSRVFSSRSGARIPESEIEETEGEVIVNFELHGIEKKDIDMEIDGNRIRMKAVRKVEFRKLDKEYYHESKSFNGYQEMLSLPCKVIPEKAKAKFENGVLEVRLPKDRKKKKIEIV